MAPGIRYHHNPELDCRAWLELPGGRRAYVLGDAYGPPGRVAVRPVGVFDRLTRAIWIQSSLRPPLHADIGLWSLAGLARAMGRDPADVRAELLAGGPAAAYRPLSLDTLRRWFPAPGDAGPAE